LRGRISEAIGMEDEEIAKRLADYYKANEKELTEKSVSDWLRFKKVA